MAATAVEATTMKATGTESAIAAAGVEAAAADNNAMPRQCARCGPVLRLRGCTPLRQMWPKNVSLRALRDRHGAFGDGVLRRYAASFAALVATLASIVGPGLSPRRR
jgi:hypothetical protein